MTHYYPLLHSNFFSCSSCNCRFVCVFWNRAFCSPGYREHCQEYSVLLWVPEHPAYASSQASGSQAWTTSPGCFCLLYVVKERYKEPPSTKANIMFLNFSELHTHWKKENSLWMESKRTNCTHSFWPYYKPNCALLSTRISKLNS